MPPADLAAANEELSAPREIDLAVARRLGFHVVSRLAARHGIAVSLGATPGSGVTAVVALPPELFAATSDGNLPPAAATVMDARPLTQARSGTGPLDERAGWIEPVSTTGARSGSRQRLSPTGPVARLIPQPAPEPLPLIPDRDWTGWWNPESVDGGGPPPGDGAFGSGRVPPVPHPRPRPDEQGGGAGIGDRPGLRRRVPQSHLAPELRHLSEVEADPVQGTPAAAGALSRYQASRQAAQSLVEPDGRGGRA